MFIVENTRMTNQGMFRIEYETRNNKNNGRK